MVSGVLTNLYADAAKKISVEYLFATKYLMPADADSRNVAKRTIARRVHSLVPADPTYSSRQSLSGLACICHHTMWEGVRSHSA